jgi:drug/metabolite transporter (DMT)-like permease
MRHPYFLLVGAVVLFIAANSLAVYFGETRRYAVLAFCGITATIAFALFGQLGAKKGLAATSAVVDILIVVGSVLCGVLMRGERLSPLQIVGIVLGLAATWMILVGSSQAIAPMESD